jgi:hypothetical protein
VWAGHAGLAGLEVCNEAHEARQIVGLREAFPRQQSALLEDAPWIEKAIGGDEVYLEVFRPARQQFAKNSSGRTFPHRDTARQPDEVRDLGRPVAEECRSRLVEDLCCGDVEIEEPGEREIDVGDLADRSPLVEAPQMQQVFGGQRQGSIGAQARPFCPSELGVQ